MALCVGTQDFPLLICMNHLSSQEFNLSKSEFLCSACLAFPFGIVSYVCTDGLNVIWNGRFIIFLCFFKITYYGAKLYLIGNDNYIVNQFLEHLVNLQTCSLAIPGSSLASSTYFSFSVSLQIWIIFNILLFFFSKHLLNCQILWIQLPRYFLSSFFLTFISRTLDVVCCFPKCKVIYSECFWWDPDIKGKTN